MMFLLLNGITAETEHSRLFHSQEPIQEGLLCLPRRVRITRRRACFLVERGLLSGHHTRVRGRLYSDVSLCKPIPITRTIYYALYNANLIQERSELIEGVIIGKRRQTHRNGYTRHCLALWLYTLSDLRNVQQRAPIDLSEGCGDTSETEPALAVFCRDVCDYSVSHPPARDARLVIEIADFWWEKDYVIKARLYAKAYIPEYWIVNITARTITVHRQPENGTYQSVVIYTAEQEIACLAKPEEFKRVDELIAPAPSESP